MVAALCHDSHASDTGVHYVGNMHKYGPLLDMISHPSHKIVWARTGTGKHLVRAQRGVRVRSALIGVVPRQRRTDTCMTTFN